MTNEQMGKNNEIVGNLREISAEIRESSTELSMKIDSFFSELDKADNLRCFTYKDDEFMMRQTAKVLSEAITAFEYVIPND